MLLLHFTLVFPWQEWRDMDPPENALEGPRLWLLIYGDLGSWEQPPTWSGDATCLHPGLEQCLLHCRSCCWAGGVRACLPFPFCLIAVTPGCKSEWRASAQRIHPLAPCLSATICEEGVKPQLLWPTCSATSNQEAAVALSSL